MLSRNKHIFEMLEIFNTDQMAVDLNILLKQKAQTLFLISEKHYA